MNVPLVLYGSSDCNSFALAQQHAKGLARAGHPCTIAVPEGVSESLEGIGLLPCADALADPDAVSASAGSANAIMAWTPRETVRRFVTACQSRRPTRGPADGAVVIQDQLRADVPPWAVIPHAKRS